MVMFEIKAYIGKSKIKLESCLQGALSVGPLVFYSSALLTSHFESVNCGTFNFTFVCAPIDLELDDLPKINRTGWY